MSGEDRPPVDLAEQARLRRALRESVILRELADILNSSLDLEHILQELVKRTTELCEVARCAVWLLEETWNRFRPVTYYITSHSLGNEMLRSADAIWHRSPLPVDNPVIQRLLAEGGMLYIEDLRTEPTVQVFAETFQTHSVLLIALTREGRPVGMMSLDNPGQVHAFSQEQQQMARAIGQQATIAIDNARLYRRAQEQQSRAEHLIERARAIYQVAMTVNSGEELPAVLKLATDHLARGLDADGGVAMLLEANGTTLRPIDQITQGVDDELTPLSLSLERLPNFRQAVSAGKPILVGMEQAREQEIEWFHRFSLKNILVVPLMGSAPQEEANWDLPGEGNGESALATAEIQPASASCPGLIVIHYTRRRKPTRGEYAFAQDIAAQCGLAIEKARLLAEARRAADLATERANTLDAVFQAMTEGITVITPDGKVSIRNNAAAQFLGVPVYSSASLETFLQRHPTYTLDGQPISYEDFSLTRALRGDTQVRGERIITTRTDGSRRVIELTATQLRNNEKQQIGLVCAFRDITVQMKAEERIRQALDTFLHIAEVVSYSTDIDDILRRVLAETLAALDCQRGAVYLFQQTQGVFDPHLLLGFSPAEEACWLQKQQSWLDPQAGTAYKFYEQLLQGHAVLIGEEYFPAASNPFEGCMVLAAPIKHDQQTRGLILLDRSLPNTSFQQKQMPLSFTSWDITIVEGIAQLAGMAMEQARWQQEAIDARASEAAMREADAMKNDFLALTAHEFRNPLTVILARSQSALRTLRRAAAEGTPSPYASAEEHLELIAAQTKQLNNIVTTFLDAARINQGQITLKSETVDLGKIARQVVKDQASLAENHTLCCNINDEEAPYLVRGDQARLAQVIANLVENAIKYSPFGGPVTVSLSRRQPGAKPLIEVNVKDQGMGIPPEAQARLFERFYRVPHSASNETRGIGLGLYLVSHLIQMHGGSIRVESSGVLGEGSRFIFTLPALSAPATGEPSGQDAAL